MVLGLMLPDLEGYEVVQRMRLGRNQTPVVALSSLSRLEAKVKALGLGADDVMTKPFDKAELLARVQAVVQRSKGFRQPRLKRRSDATQLHSHEVTLNGQLVDLTGKEYAILELQSCAREWF